MLSCIFQILIGILGRASGFFSDFSFLFFLPIEAENFREKKLTVSIFAGLGICRESRFSPLFTNIFEKCETVSLFSGERQ